MMRYAIRSRSPYMAVTWSYSRHLIDLDYVSQRRLWHTLQLYAKPETPTDTRGQLGSVIQLARDVPKDFLFFTLFFKVNFSNNVLGITKTHVNFINMHYI